MYETHGVYSFFGGIAVVGVDHSLGHYPYKVLQILAEPVKLLGVGWMGVLNDSDLRKMGGPVNKGTFTFANKEYINLGLTEDNYRRIRALDNLISPRHDNLPVFPEGEEEEE